MQQLKKRTGPLTREAVAEALRAMADRALAAPPNTSTCLLEWIDEDSGGESIEVGIWDDARVGGLDKSVINGR